MAVKMCNVQKMQFGLLFATLTSIVVLMFAWDPPLLGPLAGLNFDWSGWNVSDIRPMIALDAWPSDGENKLMLAEGHSLPGAVGPESLAFDATGAGPYTGVADGRILRWDAQEGVWQTFGVTSRIRTEACNVHPPSPHNEHICGRPLGLRFDKHGSLYIADAYFGLLVMGSSGGVAQPVSTQADGVPFKFTNDLDLDENGTVYFTDSSTRRPRRQCNLVTFEQDRSGRLLKYDPLTQKTTVLAQSLYYPNGIAVSHDSDFLLLSLTNKIRIMKYWLKGPRKGSMEEFAEVPGYPDNIRRTREGDFWVALHSRYTKLEYFFANNWWMLRVLYSLPLRFDWIMSLTSSTPDAMAIKFNPQGEAVEAFEDRDGATVTFLSSVEEHDGVLWFSSVYGSNIWKLPLNLSIAERAH